MATSRRHALKIILQSGAAVATGALAMRSNAFNLNQASMLTRIIPSSRELLPVIGLGTWQTFDIGNNTEQRNQLKEVLTTLVDKGGKVIDSSPMYGRSEKVIGDLSSELGIRDRLFMATKVWTGGKSAGISQMNSSFDKMKVRKMDLMQVHNLVDVDAHLETLRRWKAEGRILYIGITHYTSSAYPNLISVIKKARPDFVQFNYNIRDREAEKRLLPTAKEYGVATIINRPFGEASLFSMVRGRGLPPFAKEFEINSWAQYFLKFILSHPDVTCVIPGTSKPHHMEDNAGAGFGPMPDEATRAKMVNALG